MTRYDPKERFRYLEQLITEFETTTSADAKEQVLANLANFAYDPINYDHFRKLKITELFLSQLECENETIQEFAVGGICNLAADKSFVNELVQLKGIPRLITCLTSGREETVLSTITVLIFVASSGVGEDVTSGTVVECMLKYADSSNKRLSNLAKVFLKDACSEDKVKQVQGLACNAECQEVT
ncbi:armadillo repeat-containing protein 7-like [Ornithodoros turicata]|uniref:armadillo repeat-containing protein 7-like n=1 Tax=Ornithodoros turicata TaxID=34597 RepID=UPI003139F93E